MDQWCGGSRESSVVQEISIVLQKDFSFLKFEIVVYYYNHSTLILVHYFWVEIGSLQDLVFLSYLMGRWSENKDN